MVLAVVFIWFASAALCAWIAKEKNRPISTCIVTGLVLGIFGVIIAACAPTWYFDPELRITGSAKYLTSVRVSNGMSPFDPRMA